MGPGRAGRSLGRRIPGSEVVVIVAVVEVYGVVV